MLPRVDWHWYWTMLFPLISCPKLILLKVKLQHSSQLKGNMLNLFPFRLLSHSFFFCFFFTGKHGLKQELSLLKMLLKMNISCHLNRWWINTKSLKKDFLKYLQLRNCMISIQRKLPWLVKGRASRFCSLMRQSNSPKLDGFKRTWKLHIEDVEGNCQVLL